MISKESLLYKKKKLLIKLADSSIKTVQYNRLITKLNKINYLLHSIFKDNAYPVIPIRRIFGSLRYNREEYRTEYLGSQDWKNKREQILKKDDRCRICKENTATDVHHLTYKRLGRENLRKDLVGVCRSCHNRIHRYSKLTSQNNIDKLIYWFFETKKRFTINASLVKRIANLSPAYREDITAMFKLTENNFELLLGREVGWARMEKIERVLSLYENREFGNGKRLK